MWKQLADYIKQVFQVQQETQKNKADIVELRQDLKEVQRELRNLTAAMQQIAHEMIRDRQNEQHEREKMALRFELELLRSTRQLPASRSTEEQGEN